MQNKINTSALNAKIAQEIVQFKRFDLLTKHFPTAKQMVEYSNFVPQYPQRKNSVLALLVQSGDAFLLRRFWDFYFVKQSSPAECEENFLDGTDAVGQMMNYHYFREDAPFEVLREEAAFRNVDCPDVNYSLTPKQAARWKRVFWWRRSQAVTPLPFPSSLMKVFLTVCTPFRPGTTDVK